MGCAAGTIKYTLFIFNTLWAILGILVILFGGLGWGAMPEKYTVGILLLGSIILMISVFGCFGAVRESARMLWTYSMLLLLLLVLIVLYIFFNTRDVFKNYALRSVNEAWEKSATNPSAMDNIQKTYRCCGRDSVADYADVLIAPPASCCKDSICINPLNLYTTGCLVRVEEAFADEEIVTKYYEFGLLGFDITILLLAVILAIHYTNRKRRYNY